MIERSSARLQLGSASLSSVHCLISRALMARLRRPRQAEESGEGGGRSRWSDDVALEKRPLPVGLLLFPRARHFLLQIIPLLRRLLFAPTCRKRSAYFGVKFVPCSCCISIHERKGDPITPQHPGLVPRRRVGALSQIKVRWELYRGNLPAGIRARLSPFC